MAGITFPNVAGTLAPLMQLDLAAECNAFDRERARKADEAEGREREASQYVPAALGGDREALNRVASISPGTAMKLAPLLERMDASKAARLKEDADYITRTGMAILNAPPEQQPQLYARARQEAEASGRNVSQWPTTYDPGWVKFNVDKAMPVAEFYKRLGEGVTFAPPVGGAPGGGVNSFNIGNVRPVGGGPNSGFQQPASLDEGIRLAVNNVKAYPAKFNNGQPMTLLQIGERWAPRGDGANDPVQWAKNVASIGGLDPAKPLDFNDPQTAAAFARGVHGAEHGANKVLPIGQYVQALTGGSGGTPPAQEALAPLRGLQLPQGARVALQNGVPIVKDGTVLYLDANGGWGAVPLPQRAEPKEQGLAPGYRWNADRTAQEFIPGGPADPVTAKNIADAKRKADEKAIPQAVTKGLQENVNNLKQVDRALEAIDKNPGSIGGVGSTIASVMPGVGGLQNRYGDPEGTELRAQIANIGSLMIHDRSGAAVTASETPRLMPFIPLISDSADVARKKLQNFKVAYEQMLRDTLSYYGEDTGYRPYTPAIDYLNRGSQSPAAGVKPPAPASGGVPAPAPPTPKPAQGSADRGRVLFEARDAIAKGADPAKVKERLRSLGIEEEP